MAQDHYDSNDDGEVVFWSWDDGDDTTWEGSFYAERYSDGAWLMVDVQVDIATEEYLTLWATETGTSREVLNQEAFSTGPLDLRRAVLRSGTYPLRPAQDGQNEKHDTAWNWDRYNDCMMSRCGAACPTACMLMGPAWPECWGACCMSFGVIGCALEELFYW